MRVRSRTSHRAGTESSAGFGMNKKLCSVPYCYGTKFDTARTLTSGSFCGLQALCACSQRSLLPRSMWVSPHAKFQAYYGANWTLDADSSRYQWDKDTINTEESIFYLESERRDVKYINGRSRGC